MPDEILLELSDWVERNYTPPRKKQRMRPQSFASKEGRYDSSLDAAVKSDGV